MYCAQVVHTACDCSFDVGVCGLACSGHHTGEHVPVPVRSVYLCCLMSAVPACTVVWSVAKPCTAASCVCILVWRFFVAGDAMSWLMFCLHACSCAEQAVATGRGPSHVLYHVLFALIFLYNRCHLMYGALGGGMTHLLGDAGCSDLRVEARWA
jgi:hypothetical protein